MNNCILITGSEGLVGTALKRELSKRGESVRGLDVCALLENERGDVRDRSDVRRALATCRGIVHLASVSRVIWGEREPALCWSTSVAGTTTIVDEALASAARPWILYASSREVYGSPERLPATEDTPLAPINTYGRCKVAGERVMNEAQAAGLGTAIVRLSNVYGSVRDHSDRVVPAFVRAALVRTPLRVDGAGHSFDFTYVEDVARGLIAIIDHLDDRCTLPPIHLVTGQPTTLRGLAQHCVELAGSSGSIVDGPPRSFDVSHFYGDPSRAAAILGWRPRITIQEGLSRLMNAFRTELSSNHPEMRAS